MYMRVVITLDTVQCVELDKNELHNRNNVSCTEREDESKPDVGEILK
jgi:hypothetical protein